MTDTTERVDAPGSTSPARATRTRRTSGGETGLATMNVADLKRLASGLGITGTTKMRKDDLLSAIGAHQGQGDGASARARRADEPTSAPANGTPSGTPADEPSRTAGPAASVDPQRARETRRTPEPAPEPEAPAVRTGDERDRLRFDRPPTSAEAQTNGASHAERGEDPQPVERAERPQRTERSDRPAQTVARTPQRDQARPVQQRSAAQGTPTQNGQQRSTEQRSTEQRSTEQQPASYAAQGPSSAAGAAQQDGDDDGRGSRRRSRQRSRDRKRGRTSTTGTQEYEPELQINDDDVLVPVAGILDVLDNYAFVRTSGYLPGANDVYVPLGLVKKYGLRKGDAVTGSIKAPHDGEPQQSAAGTRQKFNALVRLDSINGAQPDASRGRVEFGKLTPLYPQERLRLETEVGQLTTRVIDLVAPIGKGQRGLIVAPAKAGRTMVMQAIANAVTANNPECHLMVVLVDERPEEVTEMQRAVKGEVIASTFDRPADDHTSVAELAIERAKRLVELGHDVVVLLDSITKLGRAYNLSAPASGRILSGGVDSAALYPPKKFFGAARNIENGGSLTILATALVDTGSRMDEVIFEEFKGTGNMELTLSRDLANRRVFPAVDVNASGTRREEILLGPEELKIVWKLRRVLSALEPQQSLELLLDRLKRTRTNIEFLRQVQMSSSTKLDSDD